MSRFAGVRNTWDGLAVRERRGVVVAILVLAAALLWMFGVSPAIKTLGSAPAQLHALELQLQSMQALATQARSLQGRAPMGRDDALRVLEASVQQRFGASAQLAANGDRVTVTLKSAAPDVLAQWLGQVRLSARAVATQARLVTGSGGWDGSIVFELPPAL